MPDETIRGDTPQDTRSAIEQDRALQADPELDLSGGRASKTQIAFAALGSLAIVMLVLYGLIHQRDETGSSTPTAAQVPSTVQPQGETTGSGAAGGRSDSSQQGAPAQPKAQNQSK